MKQVPLSYNALNNAWCVLYSRFADSHGSVSLRGIDPNGSGLLHSPTSENSAQPISAQPKKHKPIQKPSFVVNREDSTISQAAPPVFPTKPGVALLRQDTDSSIGGTGM